MNVELISFVRERSAIKACFSEQTRELRLETRGPFLKEVEEGPFELAFFNRVSDARVLPAGLARRAALLAEAMDRLGSVKVFGPESLADVVHVLVETVPGPGSDGEAPSALRPPNPPPTVRPTAANPRAFKGTKYKPPKPSKDVGRDLAAQLVSPKGRAEALSLLWEHRDESEQILIGRGLDADGLGRVFASSSPPVEPYLLYHFDFFGAKTRMEWRDKFARFVLPLLRNCDAETFSAWRGLSHGLELERDEPLLAAVVRILLAMSPVDALRLCRLLPMAPEWHRYLTAYKFSLAGPDVTPDESALADCFSVLATGPSDAAYPQWLGVFLKHASRGDVISHLATGFSLASELASETTFPKEVAAPLPGNELAADVIREAFLAIEEDGDYKKNVSTLLWDMLTRLPGACEELSALEWERLDDERVKSFFYLFVVHQYEDLDGEDFRRKWQAVRPSLLFWFEKMASVPDDYVDKLAFCVGGVISEWRGEAGLLGKRLTRLMEFASSLCVEGRKKSSEPDGLLGHLFEVKNDQIFNRVLSCPEACLRAMDNACARSNDAGLVSWGLSNLIRRAPDRTVRWFIESPVPLLETGRALGPISWDRRESIVSAFLGGELLTSDFEGMSLEHLASRIRGERAAAVFNPVPRAVSEYLDGNRTLREGQVERHRRAILSKLDILRIHELKLRAMDEYKSSFTEERVTSAEKHALQIFRNMYTNKRGMRRFLNAYFNGEKSYVESHPRTSQWLRKHSSVRLEVWGRGLSANSEPAGPLDITLEIDPMEVLKLGTYVGSCVGLGGLFSENAAAVLLDVNKQVLFGRDEEGNVVARQVLGISDDDKLVAFHVYPENLSSEVLEQFANYVTAFAEELGLELLSKERSLKDEYEMELILAQDWWDDGAWDRESPKKTQTLI